MKLLPLIFAICFYIHATAQLVLESLPDHTIKLTRKQAQREEDNHNCLHRNKYTLTERLAFYPFNKAEKIQLLSYDIQPGFNGPDGAIKNKLPILHDTICYSLLKETTALSKSDIDSLTDILFNVGYKGAIHIDSENMCFVPRNAIIFIDSAGNAFAYVEICFHCSRYESSNDNIQLGEFCNQKFNLLKSFFIKQGIKFGTTDAESN
jgi:hypothetical protein